MSMGDKPRPYDAVKSNTLHVYDRTCTNTNIVQTSYFLNVTYAKIRLKRPYFVYACNHTMYGISYRLQIIIRRVHVVLRLQAPLASVFKIE